MAEKIKFRLTAAKVSVSVALLALVGGVVEKFRSGPSEVHITPASSPNFLKLGGISGNVKTALIKLEHKWISLDTALSDVVHKMTVDYQKVHKANIQFTYKIQKLDAQLQKVQQLDTTFLKTDKASAEYLRIQKADAEFLKIQKADAEFLKIQAARNEFIQGRGGVVTASTLLVDGSVRTLLTSPDGSLVIQVKNQDRTLSVLIDNTTGALIPAVQTLDGATVSADLAPGQNKPITVGDATVAHSLQLQTFGDGSKQAMTLVLSIDAFNGNASPVVGQMLIGNL